MTAPLGVRVCPVVGCRRPIHVTPGGAVWARCVSHALPLLRVFRDPLPSGVLASPRGHAVRQDAAAAPAVGSRSD